MLKAQIDKDLKTAMLAGDKKLVLVLRGLKSAVLYQEVATGNRDAGLDDEAIMQVLKKEQKARRDAIAIYEQANESERAAEERYQLDIISAYLPEELSADAIDEVLSKVLVELELVVPEQKDMGRIIAAVKKVTPTADGAMVAAAVKGRIK